MDWSYPKYLETSTLYFNLTLRPDAREARATRWVAEAPHNFLNFGLSPTPPRRSALGRRGRRFERTALFALIRE